jgi:autotransporter adhesin
MSTGFSTPPANMKTSNYDDAISIPAINTVNAGSIALGYGAVASGEPSISIGYQSNASGTNSVAIGNDVDNSISNLVSCYPLTLGGGHLYTQSPSISQITITSGSAIGPYADNNGVDSDFDLYVPLTLAPTSSDAATAEVSITLNATSSTLGTWSSPAGGPTIEIVAYVRVPGGYSVTVTLTNATAGTGTIIQ